MTRLALLAAAGLFLAAAAHTPYRWTHSLPEGCYWRQRASWAVLGPSEPDTAAQAAQLACWKRRGLASPSPAVRIVLPSWPSEADLTAWRDEP